MAKAGHKACAWCGGTDHQRVTSKRCPRHAEWKELPREEYHKISRKISDAARKGRACGWCGGTDHLRVSSKRCPRHAEWNELSREEANKISRKITDAARSQQTEKYMANARVTDVYNALKHRFARYAAADLANRAAGHVHRRKAEVIGDLGITKDSDLVGLLKRWKKHYDNGANRLVCATCGIGSLRKPAKFKITDDVINAFKVSSEIVVGLHRFCQNHV